jgi:predicted NBD/HSP70 family sugar kinase
MYILFDIGGTNMRVASSRDGEAFCADSVIVPTPQLFNEGVKRFADIAGSLLGGEKCTAAAGGIAGPFDREKKKLTRAPHLPDWAGKPVHEKFSEALGGARVLFENDAALAALAEACRGAGKGHSIVAYITIGTGVGGARIVDGHIDASAQGFEPGHQIIEGSAKCLEELIGGKSIEIRSGKRPLDIVDDKFWDDIAAKLARGLVNAIVFWSPDIVVLGGALIQKIPLPVVAGEIKKLLTIFPEVPRIARSQFGDSSGLEGALILLNEKEK